MRRLRNAFVTGLLVLLPLMATIDLLRWFFNFIDASVRNYLPTLPFDFWGLGVLLSVVIVTVTGMLTQNYFATWILGKLDAVVRRFPVVGGIYAGIKKFVETLFSPSSRQFRQAVLVEFPQPGMHSIGFLTGDPDRKLVDRLGKPVVNLFIPLVPNPTAGFFLLVPEDKVTPLDISVQEAFRLIISMGIVGTEEAPAGKRS